MTNKQGMAGLLLIGCFLLGATPVVVAQTCIGSATSSTPSGDFTVNGNGTVTHTKTGLMWKQCAEGQSGASCAGSAGLYNWSQALQLAESHSFAGYNDWRLPNINELESIVELACYDPAINLGVFPATPASETWTSSSTAWNPYSWVINFKYGNDTYGGDGPRSSTNLPIRLVRSVGQTPVSNGSCGLANGQTLTNAPTGGLCDIGTASAVGGTGPWNWTCSGSNGGTTANCTANKQATPINGSCGLANGQTLTNTPTGGLCDVGTASAVGGTGPWNWTCSGSNGGTSASCMANITVIPRTFALTVSVTGSGSGVVTSSPEGIRCGGSDCSVNFSANATITLSAEPASGSTFGGWSGDCGGTVATCTLTMTAAKGVFANFVPSQPTTFTLSVINRGGGTVTSSPPGISCPGTCSFPFAKGTPVILTAIAWSGNSFSSWGGCAGSGACTVTLNSNQEVSATFVSSTPQGRGDMDPGLGVIATPIGDGGNDQGQSLGSQNGATVKMSRAGEVTQADGKILLGGFSLKDGRLQFALARYHSDGTPDTTFGGGSGKVTTPVGVSTDQGYTLAVQPNDGKILLGGSSTKGGSVDFALVRYQFDGTLDTEFGEDGSGTVTTHLGGSESTSKARSLLVRKDGSILMGGYTSQSNGGAFALACYLPTGWPDFSFGSNGDGKVMTKVSGSDQGQSLAVQPTDNKILLGGYSYDKDKGRDIFVVVRYEATGALDRGFGTNGIATASAAKSTGDQGYSLVVQSDGGILLGGRSSIGNNQNFAVVRFDATGHLDKGFGDIVAGAFPAGRAADAVVRSGVTTLPVGQGSEAGGHSLVVHPDGGILLGGTRGNTNSDYQFALARFQADGSRDAQFGANGLASTPAGDGNTHYGQSLKVQSDGKILMGGSRRTSGGKYQFALARFLCGSPETGAQSVIRLITYYYQSILGRDPEPAGPPFYQNLVNQAKANGQDVKPVFKSMANNFLISPEYTTQKTSDAQYVTTLYKTFLQREPESEGLAYYLDLLTRGATRNGLLDNFVNSPEFSNFMAGLCF
ncbi:exported hypothetical protein [Gammaproteobacteria bacterium]